MNILYGFLVNFAIIIFGYLVGSVNTSIIMSNRYKNDDIRNHNSKNAGATNSLRTYGKKFAFIVLIIDILKTYLVVLIVRYAIVYTIKAPFIGSVVPTLAGLACVIGHMYPLFFGLKGGKGVACSVGLFLSINVALYPIAAFFFFGLIFWKKYVSLASIATAILIVPFCFIPWFIEGPLGFLNNPTNHWFVPGIVMSLSSALVVYSHRSNIKRLLSGTESKIIKKK
ncbi:glycerol-3-phosphate 1-O-acyltransferase PlsY [Mycoplasmopsis pullorum]|uniref:Glycerol-3-phosphate acyltransferase n=1 Tax=Mycoplasmopsis pullorum TaxID=48003 RepID=A0A1L4FRK2_9BACT|nr:glycerol-3-phosphate 1-O-acyltransferase PlsY [Mycoplasmopsis pullorum]APJ38236.1 acyl-phosphate glycerol 3-phosphate acyltransferase [Mycoplasmopsis pullorum]